MRSTAVRICFGLLAALFLAAALLQFNDDQAALWVVIYLAASAFCAAGAANRPPPLYALTAYGIGCAVYASVLGYLLATGDVTPMFEKTASDAPGIFELKEGRELGGLLVVLVAVVGLARERVRTGNHREEGPTNRTEAPHSTTGGSADD